MDPIHNNYDDSVFTTVKYRYKMKPSKDHNNTLTILPFGDIHRDARQFAKHHWTEFREQAKELPQNTLYLCMGDELEFASYTERRIMSDPKLHENAKWNFDRSGQRWTSLLCRELSFMKNRFIGCIQGNHYWRFCDGQTSSSKLADYLGGKWLGSLTYIVLQIELNGSRFSLDIVAAHGKAGGKLAGTTFNQVEDLRKVFPRADIYIMGHDHRRGGVPMEQLIVEATAKVDNPVMREETYWLVRSGSFLRGYVPQESSYIVNRLARPQALGTVKIEIRFVDCRNSFGGENRGRIKEIHVWS